MDSHALEKLTAPFPASLISVKAQSYSKNKDKVSLVLYLSHVDVARRLDEVDPAWSFAILEQFPVDLYDRDGNVNGKTHVVRASMSVCGVVRQNYGEGDDLKSAASDALKRCAMLFGVGRALYDAEIVWVPYNESQDKFRSWTYADYKAALRGRKEPEAVQDATAHGSGDSRSNAPATDPASAARKPIVSPKPANAGDAGKTAPVVQITTKKNPGLPGVTNANDARVNQLLEAAKLKGWEPPQIKEYVTTRFGQVWVADLSEDDYTALKNTISMCTFLEAMGDLG